MEGVDDDAFAVYCKAAEELEELGHVIEECGEDLEICKHEVEVAYDPDLVVDPAVYLGLEGVPLHTLTEIVDVSQVRDMEVCCALVQHNAKEGSQWLKICGGTGSHSHDGKFYCGRHHRFPRTQEGTGRWYLLLPTPWRAAAAWGWEFSTA